MSPHKEGNSGVRNNYSYTYSFWGEQFAFSVAFVSAQPHLFTVDISCGNKEMSLTLTCNRENRCYY